MKIFKFVIGIAVVLMTGCASDMDNIGDNSTNQSNNNLRSIEDAKELAINASSIFSTDSRSYTRKVSTDSQVKIGYSNNNRNSQPLYYVVNYDNGEGFAIIPSASNNDNVLAIVENGSYNPESDTINNGFALYMDAVEEYLETVNNDSYKVGPFSSKASNVEVLKVAPRVKMMPNQNYPENKYIPASFASAGCGPVSLLMACSFIKQPESLYLTFYYSPYNQTLDWDAMSMHNAGLSEYDHATQEVERCPASSEAHEMISLFCREIFERTGSIATSGGPTSTYSSELYRVITEIIPNKYYQLHSTSLTCDDLDAALWDGIVLISGWNNDMSSGHLWVADGIHRYVYNNGTDAFGNPIYGEKSTIYYHFNWGWGGSCNGYFLPDVIDPNYASIYDGDNNTSTHHYSILKSGVAFYPDDDKYIQP